MFWRVRELKFVKIKLIFHFEASHRFIVFSCTTFIVSAFIHIRTIGYSETLLFRVVHVVCLNFVNTTTPNAVVVNVWSLRASLARPFTLAYKTNKCVIRRTTVCHVTRKAARVSDHSNNEPERNKNNWKSNKRHCIRYNSALLL